MPGNDITVEDRREAPVRSLQQKATGKTYHKEMIKPYHLMTPAEKIAARIASNKEIDQRVKQGAAAPATVREFSRVGHAFLDSLPDMAKGAEAETLLKLGRGKKGAKK